MKDPEQNGDRRGSPLLNQHMRKYIIYNSRPIPTYLFDYGLRNHESGDNVKEENYGMLVLMIRTITYLAGVEVNVDVTTMKSMWNNCDSIHVIIMIIYIFCSASCIYLSGWPM
jgi:hypothetical protein